MYKGLQVVPFLCPACEIDSVRGLRFFDALFFPSVSIGYVQRGIAPTVIQECAWTKAHILS